VLRDGGKLDVRQPTGRTTRLWTLPGHRSGNRCSAPSSLKSGTRSGAYFLAYTRPNPRNPMLCRPRRLQILIPAMT